MFCNIFLSGLQICVQHWEGGGKGGQHILVIFLILGGWFYDFFFERTFGSCPVQAFFLQLISSLFFWSPFFSARHPFFPFLVKIALTSNKFCPSCTLRPLKYFHCVVMENIKTHWAKFINRNYWGWRSNIGGGGCIPPGFAALIPIGN